VNGAKIETVEDLLAALREHQPGDEIAIDLIREGKREQVTVRLAERPQ
jgi:S1-C subfamily serine protease